MIDTNNVTKYFVEIDGARYTKDGVLTIFEENSYLDHYRDLKLFYRENGREEILLPYISYPDMKIFYPFQIIDLRHQVDHFTSINWRIFRRSKK